MTNAMRTTASPSQYSRFITNRESQKTKENDLTQASLADHEVFDLDIDACLVLAADTRSWFARSAWHDLAPCLGSDPDTYVGEVPLSAADIERCFGCPVRTECAVDGLRQNTDDLLVESPSELTGYFGGLGPDARWKLVEVLRHEAAERGVTLCDGANRRDDLVDKHHAMGRSAMQIAGELNVPLGDVIDRLVLTLTEQGWSNRRIAEVLPGQSYKWVQRRLRCLRPNTPRDAPNVYEAA